MSSCRYLTEEGIAELKGSNEKITTNEIIRIVLDVSSRLFWMSGFVQHFSDESFNQWLKFDAKYLDNVLRFLDRLGVMSSVFN